MNIGKFHKNGPDTERESALAIAPATETIRARVKHLFEELGRMTDDALTDAYSARWPEILARRQPRAIIATRRGELRDAGVIVDSGLREKNPVSGVRCVVWELA